AHELVAVVVVRDRLREVAERPACRESWLLSRSAYWRGDVCDRQTTAGLQDAERLSEEDLASHEVKSAFERGHFGERLAGKRRCRRGPEAQRDAVLQPTFLHALARAFHLHIRDVDA